MAPLWLQRLVVGPADPSSGAIDVTRFKPLRRLPLGAGDRLPQAQIDQELGRPELALQADVFHRQIRPQALLQAGAIEIQQGNRKTQSSGADHLLAAEGGATGELHLLCAAQQPAMAEQQPTQPCTGTQEQQQAPKLGGEVQPFAAAQLPAALQPFARRPLGARWAAHTHSSQRERLISCSIQSRARSASAKAKSR